MQEAAWDTPEEFEDGSRDGCIFWTDEGGTRWCKDVEGSYGAPGTVSAVRGEEWHVIYVPPQLGPTADGCIYWEDEQGIAWCRDVDGAYGPTGMEYHSWDKEVWYGDGKEWLAMAAGAAEMLAKTALRREAKRRTEANTNNNNRKGASQPQRQETRPQPEGKYTWQGVDSRYSLRQPHALGAAPEAGAAVGHERLYGAEGAAAIAALEARVDAAFDASCQASRPSVWPELPLKL